MKRLVRLLAPPSSCAVISSYTRSSYRYLILFFNLTFKPSNWTCHVDGNYKDVCKTSEQSFTCRHSSKFHQVSSTFISFLELKFTVNTIKLNWFRALWLLSLLKSSVSKLSVATVYFYRLNIKYIIWTLSEHHVWV